MSNGYVQRHVPFGVSGGINVTDTALTGVTPQRSEMQQLVHELQSQDREELETLRRENMQLKMAMQLQGASGAKLEERLREAMLNRTVAIATEDAVDAGAMQSAADRCNPGPHSAHSPRWVWQQQWCGWRAQRHRWLVAG